MNAPRPMPFDLFVSYAHDDDRGPHQGKVTALVEAIRARHADAFPNDPLKDFFDVAAIVTGDYWKEKILLGLEQSAVMVAVLSPAYFKSEWCRKEWETFTQLELQRTYPGEAISPIYVLRHPDFDADESQLLDAWLKDLKNRQYVEWLPYFPAGAAALEKREVRERLNGLHDRAWERVKKVRLFRRQPWNVPTEKNQIFVGREHDLQAVNEHLMTRQTVGVTAVSGFGGIGKTTLAFRYAQRFRDHYPGGILYLPCDGLARPDELRSRLLDLAPHLFTWPDTSAEQAEASRKALDDLANLRKQDEERAYQRFKAILEAGDRKLLIFDNISDPAVVAAAARKLLPAPQNVRQLFTTRLGADDLGGLDTVPLGLLSAADALELLFRWRQFARDLGDPAYKDACRDESAIDEDTLVGQAFQPDGQAPTGPCQAGKPDLRGDAEWKSALAIVNRVQRLTIAVEVIGVHLSVHPEISYQAFLAGMKRKGFGAKLTDAGRDARVRQWITHPETLMSPLLEPTLTALPPLALRALEFAAFLPKDHIAIAWLRTLVEQDAECKALLPHDPDAADPWLDALRLLADRQLLHNKPDAAAIFPLGRMHQILQEVLIARLKEKAAARQSAVLELAREATFRIHRAGYFTARTSAEFAAIEQTIRRHSGSSNRAVIHTKLYMVGLVATLGRLQAASEYGQQAKKSIQGIVASDPANTYWQRELSVSLEKLGDLAVAQGNLPEAQRLFADALRIRQRLAESDPGNAAWQRDLSVSLIKLGDLVVAQGNLPEAQRLFADSSRIIQRLAESDPGNAEWQFDLGISNERLGDLAVGQGKLEDARAYHTGRYEIIRRVAESDPGNAAWQRDLSVSLEKLGDLAVAQGNLPEAQRLFAEDLRIAQRLAESDPGNAAWQRDLSVSLERLGDLAVAQGNLSEAQRLFADCLRIRQRLAESDPGNAAWQRNLWVSLNKLGDLAVAQGNLPEAQRLFADSLRIIQRLAESDPGNAAWQRDLWVSHWRIANLLEKQEDGNAKEHWRKAHDILAAMVQAGLHVLPQDRGFLERLRAKIGG